MVNEIFDVLTKHATERPDTVAITWRLTGGREQEMSYSELLSAASLFRSHYDSHAALESVVVLYTQRSPIAVAAMLGALQGNRPFVWLNPRWREPQVRHALQSLGGALVLTDETTERVLSRSSSGLEDLEVTWLKLDSAGDSRNIGGLDSILNDSGNHPRQRIPTLLGAGGVPIGCCLFTSGSTGRPKGVLIGSHDLYLRAMAEVNWFGLGSDDVLLGILPFSFDVGLNQLLSALVASCRLVISDSWLPADMMGSVSKYRVTGISGMPMLWQQLLRSGLTFDPDTQESLRYLTISGGSLSNNELTQLLHVAPNVNVFKTYGQTEAFRATSLRPEDIIRRPGSVGKAFTGANVYVVDETGRQCVSMEVGEIVHTGLGTMLGYLDGSDPQNKLRANPFRDVDEQPYAVFTGDLGYLDDEDFLFLKGRRDTMVKVFGNRVYPTEIADQLTAVDGIAHCHVLGVYQDGADATLVAFVVPKVGRLLDPASIRRALSCRLPSYMIPRIFEMVDHLPQTAAGKLDNVTLAARAAEAVRVDTSRLRAVHSGDTDRSGDQR